MKDWKEAELKEITLANTEYGGTPNADYDNSWYDQNGALHLNFEPVNTNLEVAAS